MCHPCAVPVGGDAFQVVYGARVRTPQLSSGVLVEPGSCSAEKRSCLCRALCEHTLLLSQEQLLGGWLCHPCCFSRRSCRDSLAPYGHVWSGFFVSLVTSKSRMHFSSLKMPALAVMAGSLCCCCQKLRCPFGRKNRDVSFMKSCSGVVSACR